jgi:hypothetical protein
VKTDFKHGPQEKPKQVWRTNDNYTLQVCGKVILYCKKRWEKWIFTRSWSIQ